MEADMRTAVGKAAHANDWFKVITRGETLGELIGGVLPEIERRPDRLGGLSHEYERAA